MGQTIKIAISFLWFLCLLTIFVVSGVILNGGLNFTSSIIAGGLLLVAFIIVIKRKYLYDSFKPKVLCRMCIAALLLGLFLRFSFYSMQDRFFINSVLSDTGVHWYGSQQLLKNGVLDEEIGFYETVFPFLFSYTGLLAVSMKIFGQKYLAVLLLNIVFDSIGALSLFLLFQRWQNSKTAGMVAASIWMLNPLEVVFCALPLAIVVVNAILLISVNLLFCIFFPSDSGKMKNILLLLLCGIALGIGNALRPIFVIFVIASLLYFFLMFCQKKISGGKALAKVILLIISMYLTGIMVNDIHAHFNPYYHCEHSHAGWSVLVGANFDSMGRWSAEDRDNYFGPVIYEEANRDIERANGIFLDVAKDRYHTIIENGNLWKHLLNKLAVLFSDVNNSFRDLYYVFGLNQSNHISKTLQNITLIYYYSVLFLFGQYVRLEVGEKFRSSGFDLFLIIVVLGLFFSSLLVEVMNRYSLPLIAIISIFSTAYLINDYNYLEYSSSDGDKDIQYIVEERR